jgi:hypothetical protein
MFAPCSRRRAGARRFGRPRGPSSVGRSHPRPISPGAPRGGVHDDDEGGVTGGLVENERRASGAWHGVRLGVGAEDRAGARSGGEQSRETAVETATSPAAARRSVNQPSCPQVEDPCCAVTPTPKRRAASTRPPKPSSKPVCVVPPHASQVVTAGEGRLIRASGHGCRGCGRGRGPCEQLTGRSPGAGTSRPRPGRTSGGCPC